MFFLRFRCRVPQNSQSWFEDLPEVLFHLFPVQPDVRFLWRTFGQNAWIVAWRFEKEKRAGSGLRKSEVHWSWRTACEGQTPALRFRWLCDDLLRNVPHASFDSETTFAVVARYQGRSADKRRQTSFLLYPLDWLVCVEVVRRKAGWRRSVGFNPVQ